MNNKPNKPKKRDFISPSHTPVERTGMFRQLYDRVLLTWRLVGDRRVSIFTKLIPLLAVVYIISPIDLLPEALIGVLGPLILVDDASIVLLALKFFIDAAPPDVTAEHLREMDARRFRSHISDDDVIDSTADYIDE